MELWHWGGVGGGTGGDAHEGVLLVEGGDGADVDDVDVRVGGQRLVALVGLRQPHLVRERLGGVLRARGDGDGGSARDVAQGAGPVLAYLGGAEDAPAQRVRHALRLRQPEPDVQRRAPRQDGGGDGRPIGMASDGVVAAGGAGRGAGGLELGAQVAEAAGGRHGNWLA